MYRNLIAGVDGHHGGRAAAALAGALTEEQGTVTLVYVTTVAPMANRASNLPLELAPDEALAGLLQKELELSPPLDTPTLERWRAVQQAVIAWAT